MRRRLWSMFICGVYAGMLFNLAIAAAVRGSWLLAVIEAAFSATFVFLASIAARKIASGDDPA